MEQFLTYFPSAFSWGNLAVLILGSAGGLFFGAMPGLSPTMAVALLVPFTFYLPADTSLILLGAVYTSAVAGGSISAILLSIPGAPSSIATLFDGYPMAKQGRAQEALYTVFVSSLIGGVFGVLVMILFSPPMAEFAMRFGPSELFWTAIFGITVITGLSSGAMLKGLFGGALGMLLSTVGYSTLTGEPRFVIHEALNGGIALVPALIGLFAVPQIIDLMADSHVLLEKLTFKPQKGMLRQVIKAHRRYLRTLGIGSLIGTIIGVIPGAGGQVAGLMSYDQTKKFDKNPDRFGTGDPEGVCAAESANNATVAPAIPAAYAEHPRQPHRGGTPRRPAHPRPFPRPRPVHGKGRHHIHVHQRPAPCTVLHVLLRAAGLPLLASRGQCAELHDVRRRHDPVRVRLILRAEQL